MSRHGLLFTLLLLAGSLHADPQTDAFQQGKALAAGGNTAHGKVSGNHAALNVPGYNTDPKEAALFADGKQDLSGHGFGKQAGCVGADTSGFAGKECDAINFLGDGRPDYPLTRQDALFNLSDSITAANRDGLAGLGSGSNTGGCVTTVIKNPDLQTVEHCEEWLKTEDKRCTLGRVVKVDKDVNYQCDKTTASKTSHECHKKLSVTCTNPTDGCSATGVQLGNIASDMRWEMTPSGGDTLITVGTIGNDYWGWGVYDRNTDFTINKISAVSAFRLERAWFDDWLWVKVNGVTVYVGPHGGDRLDTDVYVNNWSGEARPGSWLTAQDYGKSGDMYWDGWGNEWHKVDYMVCASDAACHPYELRTSWDKPLNIDIRPYVREGRKTLWMRTLVGGKGESAIRLVTRQYCPPVCTDTWTDGCAGYNR